MQKPQSSLEGPQPLQLSIRRGSFAAPRTIFAKQSLSCESKNRFRSVFAPGNFRRSFSKNCDPIAYAL